MPDSSLWTDTLPTPGCRFSPEEFRFALAYRVGMSLLEKEEMCIGCGGRADVHGIHITTCQNQHPARHNAIRNLLRAEAQRALLNPKNEPTRLLEASGRENERPADILIPNFIHGRDTCIDVSIVSSFTDISNAAQASGYNAKRAEKLKRDKYEADVDRQHMTFSPFVMESLGGFGESCTPILQKVSRALADIDKITPSQALRRLKQRLQCRWMQLLGASLAAQVAKYYRD